MKSTALFSAIAALGLMAAGVEVAQTTLSTGPIAAYNNSSSFTPVGFNASLNPATKGVLYEIPVNFQLTGLAAGQSFGSIAFDVSWDGSLTPDLNGAGPGAGAYAASTEQYTSGKSKVNYYANNGDTGSSTTDLQSIVAYFPNSVASAQASAGVGSPFNIGYLYFNLPANASTTSHVSITATGYGLIDGGTMVIQPSDGIVQAPAITFVVAPIPEPASIGLLGMGGLAVLARRRRQA